MTGIQSGGGSLYPIEQTKPVPTVKQQDKSQEQQETCDVPLMKKKESIPYPPLTGIEEQLDKSFKEFKGSLKEAKEKSSSVLSQSSGDEAGTGIGMSSRLITGKSEFIMPSMDVKAEGKSITTTTSPTLHNNLSSGDSPPTVAPSHTRIQLD